mmetsp:Transcript_29035/g.65745  ORF Transcript_29035/g.65745 Transcript_29035/m.65745 type:complete len:811 (+) Transcript_29035:17-2449(+)
MRTLFRGRRGASPRSAPPPATGQSPAEAPPVVIPPSPNTDANAAYELARELETSVARREDPAHLAVIRGRVNEAIAAWEARAQDRVEAHDFAALDEVARIGEALGSAARAHDQLQSESNAPASPRRSQDHGGGQRLQLGHEHERHRRHKRRSAEHAQEWPEPDESFGSVRGLGGSMHMPKSEVSSVAAEPGVRPAAWADTAMGQAAVAGQVGNFSFGAGSPPVPPLPGGEAQPPANMELLQASMLALQAQLQQQATRTKMAEANSATLIAQLKAQRGTNAELEPMRVQVTHLQRQVLNLQQQLTAAARAVKERDDRISKQAAEIDRLRRTIETKDDQLSETRARVQQERQTNERLTEQISVGLQAQSNLKEQIQKALASKQDTERQVLQLKHLIGGTPTLQSSQSSLDSGSRIPTAFQSSPAYMTTPAKDPGLQVHAGDELAQSLSAAKRRASPEPDSAPPRFPSTSVDQWEQTPEVHAPTGAAPAVAHPTANSGSFKSLTESYRELLTSNRGLLFNDGTVELFFSLSVSGIEAQFEIRARNVSTGSLHRFRVHADNRSAHEYGLRITSAATTTTLASRQEMIFHGKFTAHQPFEVPPTVELEYLTGDDMERSARLRLPITVAKFLTPLTIKAQGFFDKWEDPSLLQLQCRFPARKVFLEVGGHFFLSRALELGGCTASLQGLDCSPNAVVVAGVYPRKVRHPEVLIRVELGKPPRYPQQLRLTIKSTSEQINRALYDTLLDLLCEVSPHPALKAKQPMPLASASQVSTTASSRRFNDSAHWGGDVSSGSLPGWDLRNSTVRHITVDASR